MITISMCMIVKNEEAVLERCLKSTADLMDEIIIVDTGSTDKTKEIAARYTDKIYDFAWTGSFADARNASFSHAGMDYIYCADADEVLDEENRERFRRMKQTLLPEIEIVQMYYCNQMQYNSVYNYDKEYRPKLYKRLRQFQWEAAIHEMVVLEPIIYDSDIEILHLPKSSHAGRDLQVFAAFGQKEERLTKRLHNLYARELFLAGEDEDFKAAAGIFEKSFADETREADELKEAGCVLAHTARILGDKDMFFKYALKNIACDGCSEMCMEIGSYYKEKKDYEEAVLWFYNAAYETQSLLDIRSCGDRPRLELAECYQIMGYAEQSESYREEAQRWKSENLPQKMAQ